MPVVTSELADKLYTLSNVGLVVGAVLALVGTIGAFWTGGIRDRYSDDRLRHAEIRVAEANQNAAAANERAAQSEKDAALANLQAEKLRQQVSWRQLSTQQEDDLATKLQGQSISLDITWEGSDAESGYFADSIRRALTKARMTVTRFSPSLYLGVQPPNGISISGPANLVGTLTEAFKQIGVQITLWPDDSGSNVSLVVGPRLPLAEQTSR